MNIRNDIARDILISWGYHNVTVGDIDGRNFRVQYNSSRRNRLSKDRTYKTRQAVAHAYRLADIAIAHFTKLNK